MSRINWKKEVFTIPNWLSLFRLALIPVYLAMYRHAQRPGDYWLTGSILAISCTTDLLDGQIARRYGMISTLGKILDPLADKATQLTLTACLSVNYPNLYPLLSLLILKECFQLCAALWALQQGKMLDGALPEGKLCTGVLFSSLILLVFLPGLPPGMVRVFAWINGGFLLLSFRAYFFAYHNMIVKTT